MSQRLVYFNGEFIPEREARISIFDSALMFGDMVFEVTRSFSQRSPSACANTWIDSTGRYATQKLIAALP